MSDRPADPGRTSSRRWPWFALAVAIVGALGTGWLVRGHRDPAQVAPTAAPAGWHQYRAADGSFVLVGPDGPEADTVETNLGTEHRLRFPAHADETLAVMWIDLPSSAVVGRSEGELLDSFANSLLNSFEGVLAEQDQLRAGGHPGVGLRLLTSDRTILLRLFAIGGRVFEVGAAVPAAAPGSWVKDAGTFVDSFDPLD